MICNAHFRETDFTTFEHQKLLSMAVPIDYRQSDIAIDSSFDGSGVIRVYSNNKFISSVKNELDGVRYYQPLQVYASKPKTIDELKCNIRAEIAAIMPEMLANVMQNARKRAAFCVSNGGGHLIDVVF